MVLNESGWLVALQPARGVRMYVIPMLYVCMVRWMEMSHHRL